LRTVVLVVAVARPHAERHRRRHAGVAALDPLAPVDVAQLLDLHLPLPGKPIRHAEHQRSRLGVHARAVVLPSIRRGHDQHPERTLLEGELCASLPWLHAAQPTIAFAVSAALTSPRATSSTSRRRESTVSTSNQGATRPVESPRTRSLRSSCSRVSGTLQVTPANISRGHRRVAIR